jgi:large subunit ribosomal protein L37Ae
MPKTKKVKAAGRLGSRYGTKIRKRLNAIESVSKKTHRCPECLKPGVKRLFPGVWKCRKCGLKFAGKAYKPE